MARRAPFFHRASASVLLSLAASCHRKERMRARGLASGPTSGHHFIRAFWPFHFCRSALIVDVR